MDQAVKEWRRLQRAALIATRETMSPDERKTITSAVATRLDAAVATLGSTVIGLYWPIKREINLLAWGQTLMQSRQVTLCLPVVVAPKTPLEYWRWTPGETLKSGVWGIPIPGEREVLLPDLMLAPVVGFDRANYRLGYGGGYFDRTLASLAKRPAVIGVGYEFSALETIYPQPHDIALDGVVTEQRGMAAG
ncbi:MAG TPA: 5-formyltetrahydrofolate cyclo-ligase [Acetobacteraceae bacterium]|nr:5-formyltetrahydrofolate cyclo-ligase [Acetobacteraceae bacterium]